MLFLRAGIKYWRLVFWAVLIFFTFLFLVPAPFLPESPLFHWWDKAQHAMVFAVLMILGGIAYPTEINKLILGLLLYGALIEILQSITGWRNGELTDWLADAIGIVLTWPLWRVWSKRSN